MANDIDSSFWPGGGSSELIARQRYPMKLMPPFHWIHCCSATTAPWGVWYHSAGKDGEKPTNPDIARLFELADAMQTTQYGTAEYEAVTNEMLSISAKQLFHVATVTPEPALVAIGNNVGNMLSTGVQVLGGILDNYDTDTFYLK